MHSELPLFTNLLILLVTSRFFGEIFERMRLPAMIGEIIAGIILGPSVFNLIHRTEEIKVISELGIFLLVIMAGLEIDIDDILKSMRGKNLVISFMAFFLPISLGLGVGFAFNQPLMTTLFIGLCVAITALPVSIRILMDLGKLNTKVGQRIISVAIFDDVLALTILGVLLNMKGADVAAPTIVKVASFSFLKLISFLAILSLAYYLIRRITLKGNYIEEAVGKLVLFLKSKESFFALFFAFVLLFATVTENLGFHFIIGAFFASLIINQSIIGKENLHAIETTTSSLAMGFLAPIFFAGMGLEFNISSISNYGLLITVIVISYLSKILGGYIGGRMAGLSSSVSMVLGIGLNARGIMELVIANVAYKAGLINNEIFSILVIMGVLTTLTTPVALKRGFNKMERREKTTDVSSQPALEN